MSGSAAVVGVVVDGTELAGVVVLRVGTVGVFTGLLAPHAAVSTSIEQVMTRQCLRMTESYPHEVDSPRVIGPLSA